MPERKRYVLWIWGLLVAGCQSLSLLPGPPPQGPMPHGGRPATTWSGAIKAIGLVRQLLDDDPVVGDQERCNLSVALPEAYRQTIETEMATWNRRMSGTRIFKVDQLRWSTKRPGSVYFTGWKILVHWKRPNEPHAQPIMGYYDPDANLTMLVSAPEENATGS